MLVIQREIYSNVTDLCELELDEAYVKNFNAYMHERLAGTDAEFSDLTADELADIYQGKTEYDPLFSWPIYGRAISKHLSSIVYDYIEESLWRAETKETNREIDDWDTGIIVRKEN